MTKDFSQAPAQTSAQIIPFPVARARKSLADAETPPRVSFDSWYHDEAIQETKRQH
jgi:Protein of unknown function (DUF2735)